MTCLRAEEQALDTRQTEDYKTNRHQRSEIFIDTIEILLMYKDLDL